MLVLGSAPKLLRQPQKSLVAVRSSEWTSRPIDGLPPGAASPSSRRLPGRSGPAAWAAGARDSRAAATWNITVSPRAGARICTPTGSPSSPAPKGTLMAGWPARLDGMVHTSLRYMVRGSAGLGAQLERGRRGGRRQQNVEVLVGGVEVPDDQGANLLGLAVVGVVVPGGQGVGPEHDAPFDLGPEAGGPGAEVHVGDVARARGSSTRSP